MRRAVEFEIRLSYFDRILRILPETMAEPSAHVMPPRAPGPEFEYEEAGTNLFDVTISSPLTLPQRTHTTKPLRAY